MKILNLISLFFILEISSIWALNIIVIEKGENSYVDSGSPNSNFGTADQIFFSGGYGDTLNLYIKFDLSSILPETTINSARLDFFMIGQNGGMYYDHGIYQITEYWNDTTITWNNQPLFDPNPVIIFSGNEWQEKIYRWGSFKKLEALVQQWINNPATNFGILIKAVNEFYGYPYIASFDHNDSALHPKLVINSPGTRISGIITDTQTGNPINSAIIGAYEDIQDIWGIYSQPVQIAKDTTDVNGVYELLVTYPSTYQLKVDGMNGYLPDIVDNIIVAEGEIYTQNISLEPNEHAVGGIASGIWSVERSPYLITSDILVPDNSELTIEPGVTVKFYGHYKFIVNGMLTAVGTVADSITFTRNNANDESRGWGIRFDEADGANILSYCIIEYGYADDGVWNSSLDDRGGGVFCIKSTLLIEHCHIRNNSATTGAGIFGSIYDTYSLIIRNNIIENNISFNHGYNACGGGGINIEYSNENVYIINNLIIGNSYDGKNCSNFEGGGGISLSNGNAKIINNTIFDNWCPKGSGIHTSRGYNGLIMNNIVWGNTGSVHGDQITIQTGGELGPIPEELSIIYNDIQDNAIIVVYRDTRQNIDYTGGIGNIAVDPSFVDPVSLLQNSSAI